MNRPSAAMATWVVAMAATVQRPLPDADRPVVAREAMAATVRRRPRPVSR